MTKQTINRGTTANDGTGDTLRTAAQKINENFTELYTIVGGDSGTSQVSFDSDGILFEGATADDFEVKLKLDGDPSSDVVVNIPVAGTTGDNFVLTTTTQTLTNKTLTSAVLTTPQINDTSADHQYVFAVSELAADRNVTLPLLTGDDTFVFANHAQTLKNKTIDGLTVSNPNLTGLTNGSLLLDSSSNEYITFTNVSSAVNHIGITTAATGNNPSIAATGDDTNITLEITGKGTGGVSFESKLILEKSTDVATDTAINLNEPLTVFNSGSPITPTIADGTAQGEIHSFINVGAGETRLTPAGGSSNILGVDSGDGFIAFGEGDGCQLIWNTSVSKWVIVANNGTTTG
jgi:hypothetical protein